MQEEDYENEVRKLQEMRIWDRQEESRISRRIKERVGSIREKGGRKRERKIVEEERKKEREREREIGEEKREKIKRRRRKMGKNLKL